LDFETTIVWLVWKGRESGDVVVDMMVVGENG